MDTQAIPEHKQWAVDLTPDEFLREFVRRNPRADAIPVKDDWLSMPLPVPPRGIDPFNLEDTEMEQPVKKEHLQDKGPKGYYCRGHGCEFTSSHNIGRISHERRCLHALNTKIPKKDK